MPVAVYLSSELWWKVICMAQEHLFKYHDLICLFMA